MSHMKENGIYQIASAVQANVFGPDVSEAPVGTMTLPPGAVVRVDMFDAEDPSVGLFGDTIVLEVGGLTPGGDFVGSGIYVEPVDYFVANRVPDAVDVTAGRRLTA